MTGPRQSGKTTLVRKHFLPGHRYLSLDDPAIRELAISDPMLFLARFERPLILDEVQYAPDLLHAVKLDIDQHRGDTGRFILTGSQLFPLMQGVSESLAGRVAVLNLYSLAIREQLGFPEPEHDPFAVFLSAGTAASTSEDPAQPLCEPMAVARQILTGGFPEIALDTRAEVRLWHGSYIQTYLERDVRNVGGVADLGDFQRFLFALAARSGNLLNATEVGRDVGISNHTVNKWLSVLEASGQVMTVRPYFSNFGKRVIKRPRVYFLDTGTLSYLLRIRNADQMLDGPASGLLFETTVLGQLIRRFAHHGEVPPIYFWRTAGGHEVDFILDLGDRLVPIDAKLTATPNLRHAKTVQRFQQVVGDRAGHGLVVCLCREPIPLTRTVAAVPLTWI